ncbi:glycosyltransferase family 4 protein [Thiohalomonas denitrificans]|uniref:Glycosyltransferase involved in cell wall bisynthesis n=1 Tax=Thiohalomonas denitrificans TaxID=415747 RepID=A0A1G5Q3Q5_9GAMM|nr:glycosyltransferase family 4 protein [Thiohalomonas denitrificans]SCZ55929.1 Glycosyltransferase involved in cell wall bisynthesis [Thiohalomonas denitrificans]
MSHDDRRLQLLWVSHLVPYPPKGGALQRSFNLLREVCRYHAVDLVAFVQRPYLRYLDEDEDIALQTAHSELKQFCRTVQFEALPEDINRTGRTGLLVSSLFRAKPYTVNWLSSRAMAMRIRKQVARVQYDVVHLDTISLLEYRDELEGIPLLLNHHNIESQMMLRRASNERRLFRRFYMLQEGKKIRRYESTRGALADLHITCSRLDSERLVDVAPSLSEKVAEIPNGVDLDYFAPSQEKTRNGGIIFVGRLGAYANRRAALYIAEELWPALKVRFPNLLVDIIGAAPPQKLVNLSESEPNLRVHGFVDDVRPYIDAASVYVCPITDGGGTKLKVLDALAMGKALVADPIACEGIAVTDNIDVALARTTDDYIEKIGLLLDNEAVRTKMEKAARRLVEKRYSYSAIGRQLAAHYRSISGRKNGGTVVDQPARMVPEVVKSSLEGDK